MDLPDSWREFASSCEWTVTLDDGVLVLEPSGDRVVLVHINRALSTQRLRLLVDAQDVAVELEADAVVERLEIFMRRRRAGQTIRVHKSAPQLLVIVATPAGGLNPWEPCPLALDQTDLRQLVVEGCAVEVQGRSVRSAVLVDAGVHFNGSAVTEVAIQGNCLLSASEVDEMSATPGSHLDIWSANAEILRIPMADLDPSVGITVTGAYPVTTIGLAPGAVVELEGGVLQVSGTADRATFRGSGEIRIDETSRLQSPVFDSKIPTAVADAMVLTARAGTVDDATGTLDVLDLAGESSVVGRNNGSFVVRKILSNSDPMPVAELEGVSAYELSAIDLQAVERTCRRFRPWLEASSRERARRERAMSFRSTDNRLVTQRRAEYWARMERLLTEQRSGGEMLSNVREASLRSRRNAARAFSREWWVLTAYALIGYGERIAQPLIIYACCCAIGAAGLRCSGAAPTVPGVRLWLYLLVAPLTLLRIDSVAMPNSPGIWDTGVHSSLKAVGVALLASSLLAARRIGRAT